jgi:hypothetical protein
MKKQTKIQLKILNSERLSLYLLNIYRKTYYAA